MVPKYGIISDLRFCILAIVNQEILFVIFDHCEFFLSRRTLSADVITCCGY